MMALAVVGDASLITLFALRYICLLLYITHPTNRSLVKPSYAVIISCSMHFFHKHRSTNRIYSQTVNFETEAQTAGRRPRVCGPSLALEGCSAKQHVPDGHRRRSATLRSRPSLRINELSEALEPGNSTIITALAHAPCTWQSPNAIKSEGR